MPTITFGVELEAVKLTELSKDLLSKHSFRCGYDRTITGRNGEILPTVVEDGGGCEIVTPPLRATVDFDDKHGNGYKINMGRSLDVVQDLCRCVLEVNKSCGVHIHLGKPRSTSDSSRSLWTGDDVKLMLLLGRHYENRLFDVCPETRRKNRYCRPIGEVYSNEDFAKSNPLGDVLPRKYSNTKRYCWLNAIETLRQGGIGTIEIRMLGNVRRFSYIKAWVELWVKMAAYVAYVNPVAVMAHAHVLDTFGPQIDAVGALKVNKLERINVDLKPRKRDAVFVEIDDTNPNPW